MFEVDWIIIWYDINDEKWMKIPFEQKVHYIFKK